MKKNLFLFVLIFLSIRIYSQSIDNRFTAGISLNSTSYQGDLGNGYQELKSYKPGIDLFGEFYVNRFLDLKLNLSFAQSEFEDEDGTYSKGGGGHADSKNTDVNWSFDNKMQILSLNAKIKLNNDIIIPEESSIQPYFLLGLGFSRSQSHIIQGTDNIIDKDFSNSCYLWAIGSDIRLNNRLELVVESGIFYPSTDVYDGIDEGSVPEWPLSGASDDEYLQIRLGVKYIFGTKRYAGGGAMCP